MEQNSGWYKYLLVYKPSESKMMGPTIRVELQCSVLEARIATTVRAYYASRGRDQTVFLHPLLAYP